MTMTEDGNLTFNRPWLVMDDSDDSRDALVLLSAWCKANGREFSAFPIQEVADCDVAPTLVMDGRYEGLPVIQRVLMNIRVVRLESIEESE